MVSAAGSNEVQGFRHTARDKTAEAIAALQPVAGLLKGVQGLSPKDGNKRAKAVEAALDTALDALDEARDAAASSRAILKARKNGK